MKREKWLANAYMGRVELENVPNGQTPGIPSDQQDPASLSWLLAIVFPSKDEGGTITRSEAVTPLPLRVSCFSTGCVFFTRVYIINY